MCTWSIYWSASRSRRIGLSWRKKYSTEPTFWSCVCSLYRFSMLPSVNVIASAQNTSEILDLQLLWRHEWFDSFRFSYHGMYIIIGTALKYILDIYYLRFLNSPISMLNRLTLLASISTCYCSLIFVSAGPVCERSSSVMLPWPPFVWLGYTRPSKGRWSILHTNALLNDNRPNGSTRRAGRFQAGSCSRRNHRDAPLVVRTPTTEILQATT